MDGVPSPEECCAICGKHSKCKAWTWVADAKIPNKRYPIQCWLKGHAPTHDGRVRRRGFVSGLPSSNHLTWSRSHADEPKSEDSELGDTMPMAVAKAFGGRGFDTTKWCPPSAIKFMMMA